MVQDLLGDKPRADYEELGGGEDQDGQDLTGSEDRTGGKMVVVVKTQMLMRSWVEMDFIGGT